MGWVRSAKGHDIDPISLNYKAGDGYKTSVKGKSNQPVIFIDSTGRSYAIEPNTLPSARGQGEPLSGKLSLPIGAQVEQMVMSSQEDKRILMASDAGYGFICTYSDLIARNRNGKAVINLPENAKVMPIIELNDSTPLLLALTNLGRMLVFPVETLPSLSKGKGNKIIAISSAQAQKREDYLINLALISDKSSITLYAGKRKLTLKAADLQKFMAERGKKGTLLPRGLQRVDRIEIDE